MKTFEHFLQLHHQSKPLLIGNIWDVHSATTVERLGFEALATSSAALANSFGYEDGEQVPFDLIVQLAKRVVQVTDIPLSVDIEGGFSRTVDGICKNIERLHDVGVVGINLEDSLPGAPRTLQGKDTFREILDGVVNHLTKKSIRLFINVRTDGFLQGLSNALDETIQRIHAYEGSGVHGIFTPCIVKAEDIETVVANTKLPVNVMCMPLLPSFSELQKLGAKRISMGNFVHQFTYKAFENELLAIQKNQSFSSLF